LARNAPALAAVMLKFNGDLAQFGLRIVAVRTDPLRIEID
jgi:hypothetical protein